MRDKTKQELEKLVQEKKLDLEKVRAEIRLGRQKNVRLAKNLRREIAQLLTIWKEK